MKLVDILARELKVWPENLGEAVGQCSTGYLHNENEGVGDPVIHSDEKYTRSEDWFNEVVTRAEWQAAVDALNAPKVVEWDGDGLPPTGTICELQHMSWNADRWEKREILYAGSRYLVTTNPEYAGELGSYIWEVQFRPLLTSDKDKEIREMALIPNTSERGIYDVCAALYEAGYRKEPKPCGS